jgi:glutamine synthetase
VAYQAEYIWLDGTSPTPLLRSKTKIVADGKEPPMWGFDGSSTNQAPGDKSDCALMPVFSCPDPIRGGSNVLVLCEVANAKDLSPHETNTRAQLRAIHDEYETHEIIFGLEQEYTMVRVDGSMYGFPANGGFPGPQGPYYCGVGAGRIMGRPIIEKHTQACLDAGLMIEGTNSEVMPGQWEFQVGAADPLTVSDHLIVGRWLLERIAEDYDVAISFAAKPAKGDWNGAGCHTNFSTKAMRSSYDAVIAACEAIGKKIDEHIAGYGHDIESRLTGSHETAPYNEFSYGVSNRGASIRIPWQVERDGKGYAEDRRPNANCDPYIVTRLITHTVCSAESTAL